MADAQAITTQAMGDLSFSSNSTISYLTDYQVMAVYFLTSTVVGLLLFMAAYVLSTSTRIHDLQKTSIYECGFDPFDDSRAKVDIQFFQVAILFIIFDVEIILLFPWVAVLLDQGLLTFFSGLGFLIILAIGLVYEFRCGILDW
jgi:NADH:ubiquinone oxidoreductase subunit 3 (subunit A)